MTSRVTVLVVLAALLFVAVRCDPAGALTIPPEDHAGVLPGNQEGTLAGAMNGVGYYNYTDNPDSNGFGPGGAVPGFNLPAQWAYGPASVAIHPLYTVKNTPYNDTLIPISFSGNSGNLGIGTLGFVSTYSDMNTENDYYTNPAIRVNLVHYTAQASVTGMSSVHYFAAGGSDTPSGSWSDLNAIGGGSVAAGCWSGAGGILSSEQWACMDVSFALGFSGNFYNRPAGTYTLSFSLYASSTFGVYKKDVNGNFIAFDSGDTQHNVTAFLGSATGLPVYQQDFTAAGSFLTGWIPFNGMTLSSSQLDQYIGTDGSLTLFFRFLAHCFGEFAGEQCYARYCFDYLAVTLTYDGNLIPSGNLVTLRRSGFGSEQVPSANVGTSYAEWAFHNWDAPGGTTYTLWWDNANSFYSTFSFKIFLEIADRYYNYKIALDGLPAFPASINGLSFAGTAIDLVIAPDRHSASVVLPSLAAFPNYNVGNGSLSLAMAVHSQVYDNLTYALAVNYSITIPLSVNYTGGAGSMTINLPPSNAFSMWCTQGYFTNGVYVVAVTVGGNARTVFYQLQGYAGDCPLYNSSWNEPSHFAIFSDALNLTLSITTDPTVPMIMDAQLPPLPYPDALAVLVQEKEYLRFNLSYSAPSAGTGFDHVNLVWANDSGKWYAPMNITWEYAHLEVPANTFYVGTYWFYMVVISGAGNFAATPARNITITYENQSPVCYISYPGNNSAFASAFPIFASVADVNLDNSTIRVEVWDTSTMNSQTFHMAKYGPAFTTNYSLSEGYGDWPLWSSYFPSLPDGWHFFRVLADDTRGNHGNSSWVRFLVDHQAPSMNIIAPVNGSVFATPPAVLIQMADASGDLSLYYSINGGNWTMIAENFASPATLNGTMPPELFANITEGPFTITFLCFDGTGENYVMGTVFCRKDTRAPYVMVSNLAPGVLLGASVPAVNFTIMDDSPVNCTIRFIYGASILDTPVPALAGTPDGGNSTLFSYMIPASVWVTISYEGPAFLNVTVLDAQGLLGSAVVPLFIDTIAPRVTILYPLDGAELSSAPSIRVSAADANFVAAWYSLDAGTNRYSIAGLPGTVNFACDPTAWDNAYAADVYLLVAVEDAAGNVGFARITIARADFLKYGPGPNPWLIFDIFNQQWPVQLLFWAPVGIFAVYAVVARRRKQAVAPQREVAL